MKKVIHNSYKLHTTQIDGFIDTFDVSGDVLVDERNKIRLFKLEGRLLNIKSFRIPNLFNQIAYKFFRKSKAQRSYEYACKLKDLGIGTPEPIAYYEYTTPFLFKRSFYVSEQLNCDFMFRDLVVNKDFPDSEAIIRAFTRFTFQLHEKDIHFLDHSPGNTLIKKYGKEYLFYLVDLNRMNFVSLDLNTRMKNFSRLSASKEMIEIMSDEYAKVSGQTFNEIFYLMWKARQDFEDKKLRKRRLKKRFGL